MTDPKRHDWIKIIAEIKAGYKSRYGRELSDYRLGVMCSDADKKVVRNWQHGVIPDHYRGCLLLEYCDELRALQKYRDELRALQNTERENIPV